MSRWEVLRNIWSELADWKIALKDGTAGVEQRTLLTLFMEVCVRRGRSVRRDLHLQPIVLLANTVIAPVSPLRLVRAALAFGVDNAR